MSDSVNAEVDLLVANWNTLPWLRLLDSQLKRVKTAASFKLTVWDDVSTDGSIEWLKKSGTSFHSPREKAGHANGLHNLIKATSAPYIAFLDVDALPIEEGWLDDALLSVKGNGYGAAGLDGGHAAGRPFIHPSFCVLKRQLFNELKLSLNVVESNGTLFDVGQFMCMKIQDAGYRLKMVGSARGDPWDKEFSNKVFHFWGATNILAYKGRDESIDRNSAKVQKKKLVHLGLWEELWLYLIEAAGANKNCKLYF